MEVPEILHPRAQLIGVLAATKELDQISQTQTQTTPAVRTLSMEQEQVVPGISCDATEQSLP